MNIPLTLVSGDTWSWTDSLVDYPATTWTLTHYFRGPKSFNVVSTASGSNHVSAVTAAASGTYSAGEYQWIARVTDGTSVLSVGTGVLTVEPNLADASVEHRSFWRRLLDELEPVMLGRAGTDQLSMSIAGRSLQRMSWEELMAVYDRAKLQVASERGGSPGRVFISFGRP